MIKRRGLELSRGRKRLIGRRLNARTLARRFDAMLGLNRRAPPAEPHDTLKGEKE